jgi:anti-anti-sigma factor
MAAAIPVNRLEQGDHACVTFSDAEERLDILAAFVSAGLECGDKVICFTDTAGIEEDLRERDVVAAERQLCVVPTKQFWGDDAGPDAVAMVKRLAGEMARAQSEGRRGLRITADMCWAARPQANAEQLLAFESEVGTLFAEGKLTAICEYDRETFDSVTLAYATRVHPRTVAATVYHDDPTLRICRQHVPPGVRVAGELDYTRADVLSDALAEAVRLDHDVHLNLNHLRFIDAGAAAVILRAGANLPASRRMVVVCTTPIDRTLAVAGAAQVMQLTIMVRP